jgi:hypothetical protein
VTAGARLYSREHHRFAATPFALRQRIRDDAALVDPPSVAWPFDLARRFQARCDLRELIADEK